MNKLEIMVRLACADIGGLDGHIPEKHYVILSENCAKLADALIAAAGKYEEVPTKGTEIEAWAVVDRLGVIWMHDIYFDDESYNKEKAEQFDRAYQDEAPHRVVRLTGRVE